ncbi:class I SAM-dependent methyltransferase [Acinetobacter nematophilus]|uniref:Class I SAM-dependent methyltransferase n=1 Tax=Acinetobacter nematophilus TaxID=2994642 RepID=A0A9X3DWZ4_9GAMM|nr:class I SAM-dependent methyltransferase [Acinetobacter nematophilus]MCX5469505.1 class I SAM-dependent methyltransferase [Acinetobacter nematophilus]
MSDQQLSKHRHISFTAHYTGYIWYQMGISHPLLATSKGKRLAMIAHPIESWGERFVGGSMRTTLTQRHTILDDRLHQLIAQFPDLQVLEIAAGLSPRGWWFRQQYAQIDYRELDLPEMAKTKQAALKLIDPNSPEVLSIDLFTQDFQNAFKVFDPQKPLVVISEGLINYFNKNLLKQLIQSIADYGKNFKALHYLTDIYPEPVKNKLATVIWNSSKLLKLMSRSAFTFHFISPEHVRHFISGTGFKKIEVIQPSLYFNQNSKQDPEEHLGDLVWVIDAQL